MPANLNGRAAAIYAGFNQIPCRIMAPAGAGVVKPGPRMSARNLAKYRAAVVQKQRNHAVQPPGPFTPLAL